MISDSGVVIAKKELVTVQVYYWMPDYNNIIQEFLWQTLDITPHFFRVHRFLNFWHKNIDAIIQEVNVANMSGNSYNISKGEIYNG
jgi:uncharacterized protein Usg|tara:strand:- start:174 stop:431 length:258 start_codon:yes stop_codon:yes gene_type:complete